MGGRVRLMLQSLTVRLLFPLIATITAVLVAYAIVSFGTTRDQWTASTRQNARRTSELVKRATHYGMLLNQKEDVHHTIRQLAKGPGVAGIRVYDKQGTIIFSANNDEIGHKVDLQAEACVSCHQGGLAEVAVLEPEDTTRQFRTPAGKPILGLINPIRNEPECSSASCHAHPSDQTILGVLDVQMSMEPMELGLQLARRQMMWATLAMILLVGAGTIAFFYWVVRRPIRRLAAGTQQVARGDLTTRIEATSKDELGRLASAFNDMTEELQRALKARRELTGWSQRLEQEVIKKTEELGRVQRQVMHMEKMASLGKLSATVAHELNNPLAGILTYARLVEREVVEQQLPEDIREQWVRYLGFVQKESARCGNIVRNLLLFARQSGVEFAPIHINEIVRQSLMLIQHHLEMSDIQLESEFFEGDDEVVCDAGQMQQALVALLVNAVEAMSGAGSGGTLTVKVRGENDDICIDIGDTGPGIPDDVLEHIFEPFFSTKNKESGVGLGLAVVYGIVQRHGYAVDVESSAGEGTVFHLRLTRQPTQKEGDEGAHEGLSPA